MIKLCRGPGPCEHEARTLGLCPGHYMQQRRGATLTPLRRVGVTKLPTPRVTPEAAQELERQAQAAGRSLYEHVCSLLEQAAQPSEVAHAPAAADPRPGKGSS